MIFGGACRDCPLRARCTTSRCGRTLHLHRHDALQRAHRARVRNPELIPSSNLLNAASRTRAGGAGHVVDPLTAGGQPRRQVAAQAMTPAPLRRWAVENAGVPGQRGHARRRGGVDDVVLAPSAAVVHRVVASSDERFFATAGPAVLAELRAFLIAEGAGVPLERHSPYRGDARSSDQR